MGDAFHWPQTSEHARGGVLLFHGNTMNFYIGAPRELPPVLTTDPQAAAVGATEARHTTTTAVSTIPRTETYTRAYAESNGFLTLLSDGERLTGAYALGPEAGEWLQQATLAIRARVPLDVLRDTIQPFPTFSEIYLAAVNSLLRAVAEARDSVASGHSRQDE